MNAAWQAASEEMYKASQEQQQSQGAAGADSNPSGNTAGDVTDVDFEEVKDDKK
jgi:molecular chaperone DnaK